MNKLEKLNKDIKELEHQIMVWEGASGEDDGDYDHVILAELIKRRDALI
jgi:hypothetical protein